MVAATIYHNNRCSKSRQALAILEAEGVTINTVYYLKTPPTEAVLDNLLTKLNLEPLALIRTGEARFKELGLNSTSQKTRSEWLKLMSDNPILIERPIIVVGNKAVIGRPPEKVLAIL